MMWNLLVFGIFVGLVFVSLCGMFNRTHGDAQHKAPADIHPGHIAWSARNWFNNWLRLPTPSHNWVKTWPSTIRSSNSRCFQNQNITRPEHALSFGVVWSPFVPVSHGLARWKPHPHLAWLWHLVTYLVITVPQLNIMYTTLLSIS